MNKTKKKLLRDKNDKSTTSIHLDFYVMFSDIHTLRSDIVHRYVAIQHRNQNKNT